MTQRVLISGSVAFDIILTYEGRFHEHILPDQIHKLNVSFPTPRMDRLNGGCAANIAYSMALLGGHPAILGAVGRDGGEYARWLEDQGIDTSQLVQIEEMYTPQCFILNDKASNMINGFHAGAMGEAWRADVRALTPAVWGIVGPNSLRAMLHHGEQMSELGVPWIFDPGQSFPLYDGETLRRMVRSATALTVNDYEYQAVMEKTGWDAATLAREADILLVTLGADGSDLIRNGTTTRIAPSPAASVVDPTGCGDAFRGGLLHGLAQGWDWVRSARLGSVMGAIKIEQRGPQGHRPDRAAIAARFQQTYGEPL